MMTIKSLRPSSRNIGLIYGFRQYQYQVPVYPLWTSADVEALAEAWMEAQIALAERGHLYLPQLATGWE